jgi:hypothetical protein
MPVVRTPVKNLPFHAGSLAANLEYIWEWLMCMAAGTGAS